MLYHYLASDKTGKMIEAEVDAENLKEVLHYLAGQELRPISVHSARTGRGSVEKFFGGINLEDKVFLMKYLTLMLKVGTDLLGAINILIADFEKPAIKNFLIEVRENLTRGAAFWEAFAKHPKIFSPVFVSLLKAGEASGNLEGTFDELSESLTADAELRSHVRAALIYPSIILVASLGIFLFLATFALPKIANVFIQGGINPPTFSRIVFGIGLFVNDHIFSLLVALIVGIVGGYWIFWKTTIGKRMRDRILWHTPVVKNVYRDLAIQRFAATFSSLIKAGLPIIDTTKITADVVGADEFREALLRIADEGLAKGFTIGEAFRREPAFPRVVTNLVAISEKAGHLEGVLKTLAGFYTSRVDGEIKTLVSLLEPLLLLFMGGLVATIALSIIVPIYQITNNF